MCYWIFPWMVLSHFLNHILITKVNILGSNNLLSQMEYSKGLYIYLILVSCKNIYSILCPDTVIFFHFCHLFCAFIKAIYIKAQLHLLNLIIERIRGCTPSQALDCYFSMNRCPTCSSVKLEMIFNWKLLNVKCTSLNNSIQKKWSQLHLLI